MANEELKTKISADAQQFNQTLSELTGSLGSAVKNWERDFQNITESTNNVNYALTKVKDLVSSHMDSPLSAEEIEEARASIESTIQAVDALSQKVQEISDGASNLGVGFEAFQEISEVASQAGVEMSNVSAMFENMNASVVELANNSGNSLDAFHELCISFDEIKTLSPEEKFKYIAEYLELIDDDSKRAAIVQKIFGQECQNNISFLSSYGDRIEEIRKKGGIITEKQRKDIDVHTRQVKELRNELEKLAQKRREAAKGAEKEAQKANASIWNGIKSMLGFSSISMVVKKTLQLAWKACRNFFDNFFVKPLEEAKEKALEAMKEIERAAALAEKRSASNRGVLDHLKTLGDSGLLSSDSRLLESAASYVNILSIAYNDLGISIDKTTGEITGLDEAIYKMMAQDHSKKINALEVEIQKLQEALAASGDEAKVKLSNMYALLHGGLGNGISAAEQRNQLSNDLAAKQAERQSLLVSNPSLNLILKDRAKAMQDAQKKRADAEMAQQKAQQDLEKAFEKEKQESIRKLYQSEIDNENRYHEQALSHLNKRLFAIRKSLSGFGFSTAGLGFNPLSMTGQDAGKLRRQVKLDAGIQDKLARQASGHRVHFSSKEKARIQEEMDAQMEAARIEREIEEEKQRHADELVRLQQEASEALKQSSEGLDEAAAQIKSAGAALKQAAADLAKANENIHKLEEKYAELISGNLDLQNKEQEKREERKTEGMGIVRKEQQINRPQPMFSQQQNEILEGNAGHYGKELKAQRELREKDIKEANRRKLRLEGINASRIEKGLNPLPTLQSGNSGNADVVTELQEVNRKLADINKGAILLRNE